MTSHQFSVGLRPEDLDDHILPSQSCVVTKETKTEPISSENRKALKLATISLADEIPHDQMSSLKNASITLADCLACSGCITSAESVLISSQSLDEFEKRIKTAKAVVVTLSLQSLLSIAYKFGCSLTETYQKLVTYFTSLGVHYVIDSNFAREISLNLVAEEFVNRMKANKDIPLLVSACPGWICYAEKTHDTVLPFISTVRSQQAITGAYIKSFFAEKLNLSPTDIYHVCVMMCFDKKLEASRDDFRRKVDDKSKEDITFAEVDTVLSSFEIVELLERTNTDFAKLSLSKLSDLSSLSPDSDQCGSDGYADFVFRVAAKKLFGVSVEKVDFKVTRNLDFKEASLVVNGEKVLSFAIAQGFRNIQNIVRPLKTQKQTHTNPQYHFIEVMACPRGVIL